MHSLVRENKIAELENYKEHLAKIDEYGENLFHSAAYSRRSDEMKAQKKADRACNTAGAVQQLGQDTMVREEGKLSSFLTPDLPMGPALPDPCIFDVKYDYVNHALYIETPAENHHNYPHNEPLQQKQQTDPAHKRERDQSADVPSLPLKALSLYGCAGVTSDGLVALRACPTLKHLVLVGLREVHSPAVCGLVSALRLSLRCFNARGCWNAVDDTLVLALAACPALERVSLSHCPGVPRLSCEALLALARVPSLRRLVLTGVRLAHEQVRTLRMISREKSDERSEKESKKYFQTQAGSVISAAPPEELTGCVVEHPQLQSAEARQANYQRFVHHNTRGVDGSEGLGFLALARTVAADRANSASLVFSLF